MVLPGSPETDIEDLNDGLASPFDSFAFSARDLEQRKLQVEERYGALSSYPTGLRRHNIPNHHRADYVEVADALEDEVKKRIWEPLNILKASPKIGLVQFGDLFGQVEQLHSTVVPNYLDTDYEGGPTIKDLYILNEAFLPILLEVERSVKDTTPSEKQETLQFLTNLATQYFDSSWERDVFTNELIISLVNVGGEASLEYVRELFDVLDERFRIQEDNQEDNMVAIYGPIASTCNLQYNTVDLYYSDSTIVGAHKALCRACTAYEWTDEQKPVVAQLLSRTLQQDSAGALDYYVKAYNRLGVESSFPGLLENLKSEDMLTRQMSAEVLYNLEVGRVGITSTEGVQYFNKVYKLIVENDPNFFVRLFTDGNAFVQRIDNEGSIGVFNGGGRLLGSFKLDLYSEKTAVKAAVSEITSKDVFLPKADETEAERRTREAFLELYLSGYAPLYDKLNQETGVKLNAFSLHEQGWFIVYYSQASEEQREEIKAYIWRYGDLGLKVFLALDYGGSGEEILSYVKDTNSGEGVKRDLMLDFYSIATRAVEWRGVFEQAEEGLSYKFSSQIHEALVRKCSEYFRAAIMIERGEGGDVTMQELLRSMTDVARALDVLKGIYMEDSSLVLERKPQVQAEYKDPNGIEKVADALTTVILKDTKTDARVTISVRPEETVAYGKSLGGEARVNFAVKLPEGDVVRLGLDLAKPYGSEDESARGVSMDIGTFAPGVDDKEVKMTKNVGRVLSIVEKSEGGHNTGSFGPEAVASFTPVMHRFIDYLEDRFETPIGRPS